MQIAKRLSMPAVNLEPKLMFVKFLIMIAPEDAFLEECQALPLKSS